MAYRTDIEHARPQRRDRGGDRDPRGVAVRGPSSLGADGDLTDPQSALSDLRPQAAAAAAASAAAAAAASSRSRRRRKAASAPPNIRSQATPVEAPKPKVVVPPLPQIAASETPRQGTAPTQGAAPVAGPGTGAGGAGNGTGSGAGGNGSGGGGDGGVAEPPHLVTPVLTGRDFPRDLLEQWPRGATVFMRLRVDARGYVSECTVDRGTGVPAIDSQAVQPRARPAALPARRSTGAGRRLQDGSDTRNQRRDKSKKESHDRSGMVGI